MPTINPYHFSHHTTRKFYSVDRHNRLKVTTEPGQALHYGLELETERTNVYDVTCEAIATRLNQNHPAHFAFERDCSVQNGFEIISEPATIKTHLLPDGMGWPDVLATLEAEGYQSHDGGSCGLHIHASRAGLGSRPDTIDKAISKLTYLCDKFYENELMTFSRRMPSQVSHWARKNNANITDADSPRVAITKSKATATERYKALNLTNPATIEFRIFRGTLCLETFNATLQFVDTMIQFCKTHTWDEVKVVTFAELIESQPAYTELASYSHKRGII